MVFSKNAYFSIARKFPSSLEDAFEDKCLSLPRDFQISWTSTFAHVVIMRDHGDDEALCQLFNRNKKKTDPNLTLDDIAQTRLSIGRL